MSATAQPDALAVGDPRRHLHLDFAHAGLSPSSAAVAAGLRGHATIALAGIADHRPHHLPERRARRRLQLPGAAATLAGLDRSPRLGTIAVAMLTAVDRLERDLDLRAVSSLDQIHLDRDRNVGALCRPRASAERCAPEERV